ncbi:NADPH-dependent FMN reductase [Streptomyces sp. NPDC048337]|uniref:NADPH-dependent FMN reductase n=1 Tax=Streptomyces sp. NPDC048337 TaxID=3365535 RepID=UPI003723944D
MKILALCGSLRAGSLNRSALRSAAELCDPDWEFTLEPALSRLPYFDADLEQHDLPEVVAGLRQRLGAADALLIATPEYAHGTSGVLKNALEWLVGGGEMAGKPVALMSASPAATGGSRAQAWVAETLTVMDARVLPDGLLIPQATRKITDGRITDPDTLEGLRGLLTRLAESVYVPA